MSLAGWIERNAAFAPAKPAICIEDREVTYAALSEAIERLAAGLHHALGLRRGDRIAHLGHNSVEFITLVFACARLGVILVPLNWRLAVPEHQAILANAEPMVLCADAAFREHAEKLREETASLRPICTDLAVTGWPSLEEIAAAGSPAPPVEGAGRDPLLIVYTSGTTGEPKGAVLTQDALFWNAVNSIHMHDLTSTDHVLTVLPLFHVGGLNIQTLPALHAGATVTLLRRFEPGATLAAIGSGRPTLTVLVPATMRAVIDHPAWASTDLSSLRMITTGSQIVPVELIEMFHDRGVPVIQVYGATETAPIAVYQRREDALRTPGSSGKVALHCELRIVDDADKDVAPGERGEVLVRGPNVMSEYWRNPAATAAALRDGWFHTGDIGHLDTQGDLWIDARKDDLIKSGGERIYPAEIEDILRTLPGVRDVAVIGRPDPHWGEVPVAVVCAGPDGQPTRDQLIGALEGRVARFKHPKDVIFVEEMPRNALGKVQRFRLRAKLRGG